MVDSKTPAVSGRPPAPSITVVYGFSKSGKTVDALYSFPGATFILPDEGGVVGWHGRTGIEPKTVTARVLGDVIKMVRDTPKERAWGRFLVFDDFSILMANTLAAALGSGKKGKQVWGLLKEAIELFRKTLLEAGVSAVLICHERKPATDESRGFIQGVPMMPSESTSLALPAIGSLVVRTDTDIDIPRPLWSGCYVCDVVDRRYLTGDRFDILPQRTPMNLREILRFARVECGYNIAVPPRPAAAAWIAEPQGARPSLVEQVAQAVASGAVQGEQGHTAMWKQLRTTYPDKDIKHLAWAHRDGFARAWLREKSPSLTRTPLRPARSNAIQGR